MKKYVKIVAISFLSFFINCAEKKTDVEEVDLPLSTIVDIGYYRDLAIEKGDTIAYIELSMEYMESIHYDFLYTALIMANKYNYPEAYFDVYFCLTDYSNKAENTELSGVDKKTRTLALEYLNEGAKLGDKGCKRILAYHLLEGKYLPKDEARAKRLLKEADSLD